MTLNAKKIIDHSPLVPFIMDFTSSTSKRLRQMSLSQLNIHALENELQQSGNVLEATQKIKNLLSKDGIAITPDNSEIFENLIVPYLQTQELMQNFSRNKISDSVRSAKEPVLEEFKKYFDDKNKTPPVAKLIIFKPYGGGYSSAGHVALSLDEHVLEKTTTGISIYNRDTYLDRNSHRAATLLTLQLDQKEILDLTHFMMQENSKYNFITNNCGAPIQNFLLNKNYNIQKSTVPHFIGQELIKNNLVREIEYLPER